MAPSCSFLATALTFGLTIAAPFKATSETHKGFVLNQVAVSTGRTRSGPHAVWRTYQRYGLETPPHVVKANDASNNTVATTPEQYDQLYLTPVTIGSSNKIFNLDVDTGSADLWTFSSSMSKSQLGNRPAYDPAASTTSKRLTGDTWMIQYGDGTTAQGNVFTDTVSVAGIKANTQAIQAATQVSSSFLQDPETDGLLGLAFSDINTVSPTPQKTFFDNIKSGLTDPIFAVDLRRGAPGSYQFGAVDQSKYTGSITYTSVDPAPHGFWEFNAGGFAIGNGETNATTIDAVADTGSSVMYLPEDIVDAYYSQVNGAQYQEEMAGWAFACNAKLPDFSLVIGEHKATVPGSFINFSPTQDGSPQCFGGIQPSLGTDFAILGDTFLKAQYVVFNGGASPSIGFADKPL